MKTFMKLIAISSISAGICFGNTTITTITRDNIGDVKYLTMKSLLEKNEHNTTKDLINLFKQDPLLLNTINDRALEYFIEKSGENAGKLVDVLTKDTVGKIDSAVILSILKSSSLTHPKIVALFTVDNIASINPEILNYLSTQSEESADKIYKLQIKANEIKKEQQPVVKKKQSVFKNLFNKKSNGKVK